MAITYFGSANNPLDDGSLGGPGPITVTPPGSMVVGDLVLLVGQCKTAEDISVAEASGQTWNALDHWTAISGKTDRIRIFWCRFSGSWGADPSLSVPTDTDAFTVTLHVFRPTTSGNTWAIDVAQVSTSNDIAPSTPFDVTITGITTLTDGALVVAGWATADDNTWAIQTGGWSNIGGAQYRNSFGTDQSHSLAYQVKATAGATGDVVNRQLTLGGDTYHTAILAFKEIESVPAVSSWGHQMTSEPMRSNVEVVAYG